MLIMRLPPVLSTAEQFQASATATSILGFRAIIRASHEPSGIDCRLSRFRRDIAPIMSSLRMSACPAFEMRPRRSLPPDENWRGTRPSQAAKSHPHLKFSIGGAKAPTAHAVMRPISGIVCKRRDVSACAARALIFFARLLIRTVLSAICSSKSKHSSRIKLGKSLPGASRVSAIHFTWCTPCGITWPHSRRPAPSEYTSSVRWWTSRSRVQNKIALLC